MAESDLAKVQCSLTINGKYDNTLDIESFSLMMKDPSYCDKFYWLEAIVQLISEDTRETTFDGIIDEMICNAWSSVREFHIHLSGIQMDGQVRDALNQRCYRPSWSSCWYFAGRHSAENTRWFKGWNAGQLCKRLV